MEVVISSRDDGVSEVMQEWTEDEEVTRIRRLVIRKQKDAIRRVDGFLPEEAHPRQDEE